MKLLSNILGFTLCAIAGIASAQSIIDAVNEPERAPVSNLKEKGCGYSRPLVVAGMIGNPPFGWVIRHDERPKKDLESHGLGRFVLDELQRKMGFSYVSTGFLSYERAIAALKRGDIDLLLASYFNPQDLGTETSIVTPGYFKNVFTTYFKKGKEFEVNSFADLNWKKGIIRREENIYPLIYQQLPKGISLQQVSTAKKAFEMLMNDEADYLIGSPYAIESELRRYKLNNEIVSAPKLLFDSNLFFVFTKNSDCWELKEKFAEQLRSHDFNNSKIEEMAYQLVDFWGEKFRDEPGLIEEDSSTHEAEPVPFKKASP